MIRRGAQFRKAQPPGTAMFIEFVGNCKFYWQYLQHDSRVLAVFCAQIVENQCFARTLVTQMMRRSRVEKFFDATAPLLISSHSMPNRMYRTLGEGPQSVSRRRTIL
jgi:hypothetical protein